MVDLLHLPLADLVGRAADPAAGQRRLERRRQVEGVGEEVIAQQDRRLVSPLGVDRRGMAADHRLVEHVVVNQRRRVDHLDHRCQDRMALRDRPARPPRQQQQGWPQPLPLIVAAVIDQLLHERESAPKLVLEDPFGLCELGADRPEQVASVRRVFPASSTGRLAIPVPPLDSTFEPLTPQRSLKSGRCRVPRFHA